MFFNKLQSSGVYEYTYYSVIIKKEWNIAETWTELKNIILSKVSRKTQVLHDITYMWNLKTNANESIYKREIDSQT